MQDVHHLIDELKARDMKLIMDLVFNHTSTQHPWFIDSASSAVSARRDWYIWRKPNPFQADLNWETPFVREEVCDILRFWLDKGVSGFRMDVINLISKDQRFPDAEIRHPGRKYQPGECYFANGIRLMDYLQEMKTVVFSKYDTLTVGEMPYLVDEEERLKMVAAEEGVLNMIFTFEMIGLDIIPEKGRFSNKPWKVSDLKDIIAKACKLVNQDGWHTLFCENHDQPRSVTRFCDDSDEHRVAGTKLLSIMQTNLPGTLYVYQGEELGMRNVPKSWALEEYIDIESISYIKNVCAQFAEGSPERKEAKNLLRLKARDNARTPMQWDSTSNGGFCPAGVKPWMRVNDDYTIVNAVLQTSAGRTNDRTMLVSPYRFWQRSIETRKKYKDLLVYGDLEIIDGTHPNVFAYKRIRKAPDFDHLQLRLVAESVYHHGELGYFDHWFSYDRRNEKIGYSGFCFTLRELVSCVRRSIGRGLFKACWACSTDELLLQPSRYRGFAMESLRVIEYHLVTT
uniref:Glycosyl hydrolase family 13 catalytic domain-containing protein n=1 Tax=Fusarium oxysporum (strain Fo5176) TaxID=660025 RepID=A0A0D2YF71_FUSOF